MKLEMTIEALLDMAYRVQCVDRYIPPTTPRGPSYNCSGLAQWAALGTRVDSPSYATRVAGARMPSDAIIIHDAVLALGDMWIEWRGADVVIWDRAKAEAEGCVIESPARDVWQLGRVASTGLQAPAPVRLQQVATVAILIIHAKNGTQPEWHEGWKPPRGPAPADGGKWDAWGRRRRRAPVLGVQEVRYARAVYLVWHAALELLAAQLDGALAGYEVLSPAACAQPWLKPARPALKARSIAN